MIELKPQLKRSELPDVEGRVRAHGPWVLLLVEPLPRESEFVEVVRSLFDENDSVGVGWVLSAAGGYYYLPPGKRGKKVMEEGEWTHWYEMPVRKGDCVLFRRWLRGHRDAQPGAVLDGILEEVPLEGCEVFFIHAEDIFAVVELEEERDGSIDGEVEEDFGAESGEGAAAGQVRVE